MDVFEFIARRIQHILPHHMQSIGFYALYSNKFRRQHKRLYKQINTTFENIPKSKFYVSWRMLIWKIYESDPLICTSCESEMKIKNIYTYNAGGKLISLTELKYYINGKWRIERRYHYLGAVDGVELRRAS